MDITRKNSKNALTEKARWMGKRVEGWREEGGEGGGGDKMASTPAPPAGRPDHGCGEQGRMDCKRAEEEGGRSEL